MYLRLIFVLFSMYDQSVYQLKRVAREAVLDVPPSILTHECRKPSAHGNIQLLVNRPKLPFHRENTLAQALRPFVVAATLPHEARDVALPRGLRRVRRLTVVDFSRTSAWPASSVDSNRIRNIGMLNRAASSWSRFIDARKPGCVGWGKYTPEGDVSGQSLWLPGFQFALKASQ
jgi:hypothetical protein